MDILNRYDIIGKNIYIIRSSGRPKEKMKNKKEKNTTTTRITNAK
jgi:hypothetical protein